MKKLLLTGYIGIVSIGTILIFSSLFTATSIASLKTTTNIYINPSYPQYKIFTEKLRKDRQINVLKTPKRADIIIDTNTSRKFSYQTMLYNKVFVLTQDIKSVNTSINTTDLRTLLTSTTIQTDASISSFFSSIPKSQDTLAFVQANSANYAIIPFDQLTNRYKTIQIDSNSPIQKTFTESSYPLKTEYFVYANTTVLPVSLTSLIHTYTYSNYNPHNIHVIVMSGTTALGRGEYFNIEKYGTSFPALYVAPILKTGDIVHVSDEASYDPTCTQQIGTLKFCALPDFINTLKYAGVNLVELTGNHNNDYGSQYSLYSINLYKQNGIKYFGGGIDTQDAHTPAIIKLGNTTFAFLGYNEPGPSYAFATGTSAGAASLNPINTMMQDIQDAKKIADVVFVDMQWENENNLDASPTQITDSKLAIDAGADVVTGSQAHRPQGLLFYNDKTVIFGLGNLFFDQMENLDTRQNDIVRHTFYNNKLISTELIPTLLYNYSQPRPVYGSDAQAILSQVWSASINVN